MLNSPEEVAEALSDLLTPKEIENLAKRLEIAQALVKGLDYSTIRDNLKVGYSTISRVNTWLNLSGQGYKIMLTRRKSEPKKISEQERYDPYSWHNIKRRYSMYFWPQLFLEEFLKSADKKEKEKVQKVFESLKIKGKAFNKQANKELFEHFSKNLGKH